MIHIYYGNGKGKTSHAIAIAIRQIACNQKVGWFSFLKQDASSENKILKQYIDMYFQYPINKFYFCCNEEEQDQIKQAQLALFKQVMDTYQQYDCIILDELLDIIDLKMIDLKTVLTFLKKLENKEVIITGRKVDECLLELSDYASDIICIKHPYQKQIQARKGIEY